MSHLRRLAPDFAFVVFLIVLAMALGAILDSTCRGSDDIRRGYVLTGKVERVGLGNVFPCVSYYRLFYGLGCHAINPGYRFVARAGCMQCPGMADRFSVELCARVPFSVTCSSHSDLILTVGLRCIPSKVRYIAVHGIAVIVTPMQSIRSRVGEVLKN